MFSVKPQKNAHSTNKCRKPKAGDYQWKIPTKQNRESMGPQRAHQIHDQKKNGRDLGVSSGYFAFYFKKI